MRMDKGKMFMHIKADGQDVPVFSEAFLYDTIGKEEARFVLGVVEEYERVIQALGPAAIRAILDVTPRLVQRLGTGAKVVEWLADARSEREADFDKRFPPQVTLDDHAAEGIWRLLHDAYCTYFDPESDMDKDAVRAYHLLTDSLGDHEKSQRAKEQARLPEKLERKANRIAETQSKRARRTKAREAREAVAAALRGEGDKDEALRMYDEVYAE